MHWERKRELHFPDWAQEFFQEVQLEGLVAYLARHAINRIRMTVTSGVAFGRGTKAAAI